MEPSEILVSVFSQSPLAGTLLWALWMVKTAFEKNHSTISKNTEAMTKVNDTMERIERAITK